MQRHLTYLSCLLALSSAAVVRADDAGLAPLQSSYGQPGSDSAGDRPRSSEEEKKKAPVLSSLSLQSGPPGTQVTIYGSGFAKSAGENKTLFGETAASVSSVKEKELTVTIPNMPYPQYDVPITVRIKDGPKSNSLTIKIQNRVF